MIPRHALPHAPPGARVGLLGGSFDPAHGGHVAITRAALARFDLDRVWWLVSPGNPLKSSGPAPLARRLSHARAVMRDPRVTVTDVEARIGTRYTADTVARLIALYPRQRFTWLMGADNLTGFHHWQDWRKIMEAVPIGVLARPGDRIGARLSRAAREYRAHRLRGPRARLLSRAKAPAWAYASLPLDPASSTGIRASGVWG
ncbi:MAG: nicotinate-nucleotide adenylyltransferase [Paracoccaceae bacterium]